MKLRGGVLFALLAAVGPARGGPSERPADLEARLRALLLPAPLPESPKPDASLSLRGDGRIDFSARDLPVAEALGQLRRLFQRNVVVAPGLDARFSGDLYGVTLAEALDAICGTCGLVWRDGGTLLFVGPAEPETRLFRLAYLRAAEVATLLRPLLGPKGELTATAAAQSGIEASESDTGGDAYAAAEVLVARDLPARLASIAEALRFLDVRPRQVAIEATILSADATRDRAVGLDLTVLTGTDFRSLGGVSGDVGDIPLDQLDKGITSTGTALLESFPSGGLTVGVLKNGVGAFLRAIDERVDVSVLANPRVVVLNKQRGQVVVGRRDGYLTTTTTQTSSTQSVEFIETGTRLLFRPFVGDDGWIRLEVHPEDSDGGVTEEGLPFKETAEVTTNILVRSGETIVIGGLFRERTETTLRKVPLLAEIPLAGKLFQSKRDVTKREELIIVLTPRLVDGRGRGRGEGEAAKRLAAAYVAAGRARLAEGRAGEAAALLALAREIDPSTPRLDGDFGEEIDGRVRALAAREEAR